MNNATPFVLNTLFPSPEMLGQLLPVWLMYFNQYPQSEGYVDHEPVYVWSVYRTTPGDQFWTGFVLMQNGNVRTLSDGQTQEACRRTRLGAVARTSTGTLYLGGIYLQDIARGTDTDESFTAEQKITVGSTVGTAPEWIDVPLLVVSQQEHKEGSPQYVIYPDSQRDEISVGVEIGGKFMPLVGTRADAQHSQPPEAQNRLISLGVYDTTGSYHPVLGGRAHFESHPADAWALEWVNSGGPGSQSAGGWEADVGVFDPFGSFVPLAGVTYADSIEGAIHPYQMMITTGVWAGGTYQPMVGTTYDGDQPLLSSPAAEHWLVSAGTFSPLDRSYMPLVGASFDHSSSAEYQEIEDYRLGIFAASYPDFIPLLAARWRGEHWGSRGWPFAWVNSGGPGSSSGGAGGSTWGSRGPGRR